MKLTISSMAILGMIMLSSSLSHAEAKKRWVSNPGLNTPDYNQSLPTRHGPPRPPRYPVYPPHMQPPGISIHYRAPQTIHYNHQQNVWINGELVQQESNQATELHSSRFEVISNWRAVGLPAPPVNMYWIYSGGRYMLQSNR